MVENPLFYKNISILNRETHAALKVDAGAKRFKFATGAHLIPAVMDEFVAGGRSLPIVFIPGPTRATPVFLVGLQPGQSRYLSADGRWTGDYLPAFLRRYPFIIGETENSDPLICIDDTSDLFSTQTGEALFLDDGKHSPFLDNTINFVSWFKAAASRTEAFVDLLQKHDLFQTITIDTRSPKGEAKTLHGTMAVDFNKLTALPDAAFLSLREGGTLPAIFAHLASLQGIDKLAGAPGDTAGAEPSAAALNGAAGNDAASEPSEDRSKGAKRSPK